MNESNKVNIVYIIYIDNLEGQTNKYLEKKEIDFYDLEKEIKEMKNSSDGEFSYIPLYVVNISTNEIIKIIKGDL